MSESPIKISTVKARGGTIRQNVRYVLAASLVLAVAAMVFVWMKTSSEQPAQVPVTVQE